MSDDTILMKYFLLIFAVFSKLVNSESYLAILRCKLNGHCTVAKFPTFKKKNSS